MAWELIDNIRGPKGDQGDKGDSATIGSASAQTLAPGSPATVALSGPGSAQHVQFGIPKGDKGDRGPAGTISSASAVSVAAGEPARVIMSGTADVMHADFEIPRGLPGVNAVENDEAVAAYVGAVDSETRGVLDNTFFHKGEFINLADYGTTFDGVVDNTAQLAAAADAARAKNTWLWVPQWLRVHVTAPVNLRYIDVKFDGFLTVAASALPYGVEVGDSSNVRVGRSISFKSALHVDAVTQTNPVIRVRGLKGGDVEVGRCDYLQLYANATTEPTSGDSSAYSTYRFTGGSIRHLELLGEGGQSWINENLFLGGDIRKITIDGTYTHNSNLFMKTSVEGSTSLINIVRGSRNKFLNVRGEYGPKIKFGVQTWQNVIVDGFSSNATSRSPGFTIEEDLGVENVLVASIDEFLEPHTLFRLDAQTPLFDTACAYPGTPVTPGLAALKVVSNFQSVVRTPIVPITSGSARVRRFEGSSDVALWRPKLRLYDANRVMLDATAATLIDTTGGWSAVGGADSYYQFGTAKADWAVLITSPLVQFASLEVQSSGSTAGSVFRRMSVTAFRHGRDSEGLIKMWEKAFRAPLGGAVPTQGRALKGEVVGGTTTDSHCTANASTTLAVAAASSASILTVASSTGMAVGDVVGVLLPDGTTHWTTIATVNNSTQVTLTVAIPAAAPIGSEVVTTRWVVR